MFEGIQNGAAAAWNWTSETVVSGWNTVSPYLPCAVGASALAGGAVGIFKGVHDIRNIDPKSKDAQAVKDKAWKVIYISTASAVVGASILAAPTVSGWFKPVEGPSA